WLEGFESFGMHLGLDRITLLMKHLGNPQDTYKSIHIGGTNGKGSVCQYIANILKESGYVCGVYTSPHLLSLYERFKIHDTEIASHDFASIATRVKHAVDKLIDQDIQPTYFEVCTAIAFVYFQEKQVDYAIIEVGLGGRFDATNIINPEISIITNVSLEHQHILGKKVTDIAFEKAGIIKEHIPVITAAIPPAFDIIKTEAEKKHAPLHHIKKTDTSLKKYDMNGQDLIVQGIFQRYHVTTSMLGSYQQENIALSICGIEHLQMKGTYIPEGAISQGINSTHVMGRMENIHEEPNVILDGAHTIEAMISLRKSVHLLFPKKHIIVIFGILQDKKIQEILTILTSFADIIIFTKSTNNRAVEPSKIKQYLDKKSSCDLYVTQSVEEGILKAFICAKKTDLILITGSLTIVADAKSIFNSTNFPK
ncbi:MAG: bifunctional folylpolyglutamate synthase/dihydrofolate synthase, partial [Candidatus Heimdallarchaeota archaeon]|nr:bifunctional folylpolyglutamate synthase/dihydrofolate synthase [Candidatus Heimdallarchaeota archaeon]